MNKIEEILLDKINTPDDLRKLSIDQLPQLCQELRQFIIDTLADNPGHFAASLGVVELTVALHYVFKTPYDRIVWDVGHQAYGHKILTERREQFSTIRHNGGLSGFPNPEESKYDSFVSGHASTSISAALGMAVASQLKKEKDRKVVAVIGDGAMTGGLAFEGLNNASSQPNNLLIILNDNNMAIDHSVGGLSKYLVEMTTSQTYNKFRYDLFRSFKKMNLVTEENKSKILRFNNSLKTLLTSQHTLFEGFNVRYFGPIDGHDVQRLIKILNDIKDMKGPKLLHIKTVKGKGFKPAELSPTIWHAPGRFDKKTAERIKEEETTSQPPLFQDVFGKTLLEMARQNEKIVGITPAMPTGCSMTYMMNEMPERTFDVGIAEAHAVTFSAGLAKENLMPFCNIYSSFMQRAYDQIIHDVAIQNLNMVMCLDRAGLVGADGATHHGAFDLAYLRCIPNLIIAAPLNEHELRKMMYTAQLPNQGPFVIRYPRGRGVLPNWKCELEEITIGKGELLKEGDDIALLSIGKIGNEGAKAIETLEKDAIHVAHYDMRFVKPLDEELLHKIVKKHKAIVTLEDGVAKGGFGSAIIEFLSKYDYELPTSIIGLPDTFIEHGSTSYLYTKYKLDAAGIAEKLRIIEKRIK